MSNVERTPSPDKTEKRVYGPLPQIVYTRDYPVPVSADDLEMNDAWDMKPMPPDSENEWVIVDYSSDKKTGWCLVRRS